MSAIARAGARIALIDATPGAGLAAAVVRAEMDDVRILRSEDELGAAEILVLAARDHEAAAGAVEIARPACAARERGLLVAAILVADVEDPGGELLAALREAADMLMVVRDEPTLLAIVAALR